MKNKDTVSSSDLVTQNSKTIVLAAKDYRFHIPNRLFKLLYVSTEKPPAALNVYTISLSVDFKNGISFDTRHDSIDPSTVFLRCDIKQPKVNSILERPSYYPTYWGLSPEQKYLYLAWLENISSPIDIGYVFIFYYGLERQLLLGDYDAAFRTIIELRKSHKNNSFQAYSQNAIVYSTVIRNRQDMLPSLYDLLSSERWGNTELLLACKSHQNLVASNLISVIRCLPNISKNYIRNSLELYEKHLKQVLEEKYGQSSFPLPNYVDIYSLPRVKEICFANISFPEKVRTLEVPDIIGYPKLLSQVSELAEAAHERTKVYLRQHRKKL